MAVRTRKRAAPAAPPAPEPVAPPPPPPPPAFGAWRIEQLGFGQCRFPVASSGDQHLCCGRPTEIGPGNKYGSWCADHLPVVFVPYQRGSRVVLKAQAA